MIWMPSPCESTMTKKLTNIGILVAAGAFLYAIETFIPTPVPWLRLGLANCVTLLALVWWGLKEGMGVVLVRIVVGSLVIGRIFHPVFFVALAGNIVSALCMFAAIRYAKGKLSLIGISVIGSVSKNVTQLAMAYLFFVRQIELFRLTPVFLITAVLSGLMVGFVTQVVDNRWRRILKVSSSGSLI